MMSIAPRYRAARRSCSGASGSTFSASSTVIGAHQFGRPVEPIGDRGDLRDQVAGPVGVRVVIGVADVEHRVQQLFFGFEVVQQAGRTDTGLTGDLGQRRIAPPVAGQQPLRDGQDPLFAVLALGAQRVVRPCLRAPDSFVQTNQLNTQ